MTEVPGFAASAAGALKTVTQQARQVRRKAEVGGLRLDLDAANAMLKRLAELKQQVAVLVADSAELDTSLHFGDNLVGKAMAKRLRMAAADQHGGATAVLTDFEEVLAILEFTIRAAAGLAYTTDQQSAEEFKQSLAQFGLEAEQ